MAWARCQAAAALKNQLLARVGLEFPGVSLEVLGLDGSTKIVHIP
jgi:hypothetical protein